MRKCGIRNGGHWDDRVNFELNIRPVILKYSARDGIAGHFGTSAVQLNVAKRDGRVPDVQICTGEVDSWCAGDKSMCAVWENDGG